MVLALLPNLIASQVAAHMRFDVVDDQMFGFFGWRIAHGAVVYRDVWDNKPPGIYWMNALGFLAGRDSYLGVVALCVLAVLVAHALFFVAAASVYFRGAAALTTVLASFFLTHMYYQGGTNRTETFLVAFELAAVACYLRGWIVDRWWRWLLAGVFCGCAFLFKQVGLAAWGAMGLHTILCVLLRDLSWRAGLQRCLLLLTGMLAVVGLAVGALAAQGVLAEAWWAVVTFNRAYFEAGRSSFSDTFVNRVRLQEHMFPILRLPILLAIAALLHAVVWRLRPGFRPAEIERLLRTFSPCCPRYLLLFTIWYVVALYGAMVSPHHFRHYLVPTIPPLLLIGGYLINVIKTELSLVRRIAERGWVAAALVAMGYFAWDAFVLQYEQAAQIWFHRNPQQVDGRWVMQLAPWETVAQHVAELSRSDQRIQCWGYAPGVYLHARRINVSRFVTTEKIGQVGEQHVERVRDELLHTWQRDPPALFVIDSGWEQWIDDPSFGGPVLGPWMRGWLGSNYVRVREIKEENIEILQRRDLVKSG